MFYIIPTKVKKTVKKVEVLTDHDDNPLRDSDGVNIYINKKGLSVEYKCWWWFWWRITKCKKVITLSEDSYSHPAYDHYIPH